MNLSNRGCTHPYHFLLHSSLRLYVSRINTNTRVSVTSVWIWCWNSVLTTSKNGKRISRSHVRGWFISIIFEVNSASDEDIRFCLDATSNLHAKSLAGRPSTPKLWVRTSFYTKSISGFFLPYKHLKNPRTTIIDQFNLFDWSCQDPIQILQECFDEKPKKNIKPGSSDEEQRTTEKEQYASEKGLTAEKEPTTVETDSVLLLSWKAEELA